MAQVVVDNSVARDDHLHEKKKKKQILYESAVSTTKHAQNNLQVTMCYVDGRAITNQCIYFVP